MLVEWGATIQAVRILRITMTVHQTAKSMNTITTVTWTALIRCIATIAMDITNRVTILTTIKMF